ncbi:MAG TPA: hypothetical protein VGN84_07735 [Solirubrobacterales bacterium]|nr:hypothetical protein [Solirubrobacterales bacterium]
MSQDLEITDGAAAGAWISPRLGGEFGAVTLEVPKDFEAYARIFHPASDSEGHRVSWADVAKACGTIPHREMQWHAVLGLADAGELGGRHSSNDPNRTKWEGSDPPIGAMDTQTLDALCEILSVYTADPARCFFGLCTIQSWSNSFPAHELKPLLELPDGRDHIVLVGPLSAVDQIEFDWGSAPGSVQVTFVANKSERPPPKPDPSEFLQREAPNLIWPADHSWLVASEVDFDSSLVGGTSDLIETIIQSSALEAWQVEPTDSLAAYADKVNLAKKD